MMKHLFVISAFGGNATAAMLWRPFMDRLFIYIALIYAPYTGNGANIGSADDGRGYRNVVRLHGLFV